jgi:hypothetical protein
MATFQTLQILFEAQNETSKSEISIYLEHLLQSESLHTRGVLGVGVNIPALALLSLSAFGSVETVISAAFSRVSLENPQELEDWATEIGGGLQYAVAQYASRFTQQALENIKLRCSQLHPTDRDLPLTFVQSLQSIERLAEHLEFQRFEETLRELRKQQVGPEVSLKKSAVSEPPSSGSADLWRQFHAQFQALAKEEEQSRAAQKDRFLRAYCNYDKHPEVLHERGKTGQGPFCLLHTPECGLWTISDGLNQNFQERFRSLASRAGVALGCPQDMVAEDFWLHRLFQDLLENRSDELFAASHDGGMIRRVMAHIKAKRAM